MVRVEGDRPGLYGAVCQACLEDVRMEGCGPDRYYKRDAKADVAFHVEAHAAWARGERVKAWLPK